MLEKFSQISIQGRCFEEATTFEFFNSEKNRQALIYGPNGSGKSTIALAFKTLRDPGQSELQVSALNLDKDNISSMRLSVFDEDYIDRNIKIQEDGLGSIVLFGKQVDLESQIAVIRESYKNEKNKLDALFAKHKLYSDVNSPLSPKYYVEAIRKKLKEAWAKRDSQLRGIRRNSSVTDKIMEEILNLKVSKNKEELESDYKNKKLLYERTATPTTAFTQAIDRISVQTDMEDQLIALLAVKIEKPQLTEREEQIYMMVKTNQGLIEYARDFFSNNNQEFCPFCYQKLTDGYRVALLESIQRVLNKDVDDHKNQLANIQLNDIPNKYEHYKDLDDATVTAIKIAINEYNTISGQYRDIIAMKSENIYTPIIQNKLGLVDKLLKVNQLLEALENRRKKYMYSVNQHSQLENELILLNKQMAHLDCLEEHRTYNKQTKEKALIDNDYATQQKAVENVELQLRTLEKQKGNVALAIDCINESLAYVFFSKDRLSIEFQDNRYYIKSNGRYVKPKNVSQGERNIIALCYFFTQIAENKELSAMYSEEQFLVIDDPVSSFDFENKIGIISLLKSQIKKVIFGNSQSRVLLMTHDISTMLDARIAAEEISKSIKGDSKLANAELLCMELKDNKLHPFTKSRNEYACLIMDVYNFACEKITDEISIGNKMRRVLEAFTTFCYRKSASDVSLDNAIQLKLGKHADYFENRMYRLVLNSESHLSDRIYSFRDAGNFYEFISVMEKRNTARDILCFMYLLNEQHIKAYLPNDAIKQLTKWLENIKITPYQKTASQKTKAPTKTVRLYDLPASAGYGSEMLDDASSGEDYEVKNSACDFALNIRGDSMEPKIPDGSIVFVHRQEELDPESIGVFYLNNEVFCKKLQYINGKTYLVSINPKYSPILIKEEDTFLCYGKVIDFDAPSE